MLLSEKIREDRISVMNHLIGNTPDGRHEWRVVLLRPGGFPMRLNDYSMGKERPTTLDVMGHLMSAATLVEHNQGYEGWASDLCGDDPENWPGRETYELQRIQTEKLRDFLGAELFDVYLTQVQRDN